MLFAMSVDRRCASSLDCERLRKTVRFLPCSRFEEPMFSQISAKLCRTKLGGERASLPEAKNAS